jgi:phosphate transport system substrate-binding protein
VVLRLTLSEDLPTELGATIGRRPLSRKVHPVVTLRSPGRSIPLSNSEPADFVTVASPKAVQRPSQPRGGCSVDWHTLTARRNEEPGARRVPACGFAVLLALLTIIGLTLSATEAGATATQLNGTGSSFDAPAIDESTHAVVQPPFNLSVGYSSTSSGQGRFEFTNQTTDFGATDIQYGIGSTDTQAPSFPFIYVPITGAGIAFMYDIPGLTQTLRLSSYTTCALLTGGITNWDDPAITNDNPGVTLPNLAVRPVTESDSAGTNYALEEWCIAEQPALWSAFANQQIHQAGGPADGVAISATSPNANWPGLSNGLDQVSTSGVAGSVATTAGAIGAVQTKYATDLGFGPSTPAKGTASVLNASGIYTQPTPLDVSSALAYATQLNDGAHQLNFNGAGPNVYNPSTYSYLLVKTTGSDPSKGAVMSAFINYALTLGQEVSPSFGYATLGLSLEQYGINEVSADVPGAAAMTLPEQTAFTCGDLTPSEVAAGQTQPACNGPGASAVSLGTNAPNGPFSSGQTVEVKVGGNLTFTSGVGIYIEECAAPGGIAPTSSSQCDVKTYQHNPLFAGSDGSVDYLNYPIYSLPNVGTLNESAGGPPACDLSNQCMLYVGENPTNFSLPHVWSLAFFVHPSPGDDGPNPGNGLPEVPYVLALPLLAAGAFGGTVLVRRRRATKIVT